MQPQEKYVQDLKGYQFFIPSYQRGYRWGNDEVEDLLDDLLFAHERNCAKYCVQPLIVKKNDEKYDVVDGQQRLTTIYIFMQIACQEIKSAVPPFSLEYQTRSTSKIFLEQLTDELDLAEFENQNIDYAYIANAYRCINNWLNKQKDKSTAIQELNTYIRKHVFFIWYELEANSNPIEVFTKVNLGKIPLTNAELIKALLLDKENFKSSTGEYEGTDGEVKAYKTALEIAYEWDKIEHGLNDDDFWGFLKMSDDTGTRIDIIFDQLAQEKISAGINVSADRHYASFMVLSEVLRQESDKQKCVTELWEEVSQIYSDFRYWYSNFELYHTIGYLIYAGVSIKRIMELTRNQTKSTIYKNLLDETRKTLKGHEIIDLSYGEREYVRNALVLFNVATLITEDKKEYRLPFNLLKGGNANYSASDSRKYNWDIEHIHATNNKDNPEAEADDSIWNLTLLSAEINRDPEYRAEKFDIKKGIIQRYDSIGRFIPLCTRNVFYKRYTNEIKDFEDWYENDKADYVVKMVDVINLFLSGKKNEELVKSKETEDE